MKLLPRDDKFFDHFDQQVRLIAQAADLLVEGVIAGNAHLENAAHQIHSLEEQADSVLHDIYTRLNSTFITPLDPEDIQSLSSHLDDVMDGSAHNRVPSGLAARYAGPSSRTSGGNASNCGGRILLSSSRTSRSRTPPMESATTRLLKRAGNDNAKSNATNPPPAVAIT